MPLRQGLACLAFLVLSACMGCAGSDDPENRDEHTGSSSRRSHPHIILITLDTTRADHLGCYGYERQTSPNLDRLAEQGTLYSRAVSTSSWTLPAHASLFTGKHTSGHGAHYDPEGPLKLTDGIAGPDAWKSYRARGMAADETTLAMQLRDAGYATGAIVAGPWLKAVFGLNKGFDYYDDDGIGSLNGRLAGAVTRAAISWLEEIGPTPETPFFLFLNYFDPHTPYAPPPEFATRFLDAPVPEDRQPTVDETIALYDAEIAYMDQELGVLFDYLAQHDLFDGTWIIATADHGELLGEHGLFGHGRYLYQPELHVPFIVKEPRDVGSVPENTAAADSGDDLQTSDSRVSDLRIQLTDVLPWIAREVGFPLPPNLQGSAPPDLAHPVVAETYPLPFASPHGYWQALFDDDWKLLWNEKEHHALYNLKTDPGEQTNLIREEIDRARSMAIQLRRHLESIPKPGAAPSAEIDAQTKEALESLGYTN